MLGVAKVYFDPKPAPAGGYRAMVYAVESGLIYGAVISDKTKCESTVLLTGTLDRGPAYRWQVKKRRPVLRLSAETWHGAVDYGYGGDKFWPSSQANNEKLVVGSKSGVFYLTRYQRKSPTLGAAPPAGAVVLLDYKPGKAPRPSDWTKKWKAFDLPDYTPAKAPSLASWTNKKWKTFTDGSMMVCEGNNYTVRKFKNFRLHAEFMVVRGKGGGNSGFYLLDRYEVQVYDSFGREPGKGGCGAIYQTFAPSANACLPAGRWQTYDITFRAAVMSGKTVVNRPRITVLHNGVKVHDDVEIPHATGVARPRGDMAEGPIMLQDHGSPVRFGNIWLVEIDRQ